MYDRRGFLVSSGAATVAGVWPKQISAAGLADDVAILREALLAIHPGLYRYNRPPAIETGFARLTTECAMATGLEQRYLALSRFLATLRCGHSYASFFNQKKTVADVLFDRPTRLPFAFRWVGSEMVVTQLQASALPFMTGAVVTSIDGVRPRDLLRQLMLYARADGSNDAKRRALLSVRGADALEYFDVFQGLLFPPRDGVFRLDIVERGKARRVTMQPVTMAVRQGFASPQPRGDTAVWDWRMTDGGVAVLTMDSWAMFNSKWAWQSWLNDRLDSLKGAKGLIVDLRRNEGGNDCGDAILARLAGSDIARPKIRRLVRYRTTPPHLDPYLDTWDDSFRNWGDRAVPYDARYLELQRAADIPVLPAQGPRVAVPMAVLTSAQNSSATFQFAELTRASGLGTLIGETTGGNRRGINGGAYFFARLPESGIEFDLPLIGYFPETPQPDAGIVPDVRIAETAADIALGRDRTLEAALARFL